jgi:cell division transport system ATP-binding protein
VIITLDLCLRRGDNQLVEGLNLHIEKGEFVFICGQAGSGKTSLLRLIALRGHPAAGRIIVDGRDTKDIARREYPEYRRALGVVFRDDQLLAYRTIAENIEISLELAGWTSADARAETDKWVKRLGLRSAADLFPAQASANERRMTKICRALARRPKIALVDEPFEGLDADSIARATELFEEANLRGSTIVATTHNVESVGRQSRRAIMLDKVSLGRMAKASVD